MMGSVELDVDMYLHSTRPQPGILVFSRRRDCCRKSVDDKGVRGRSKTRVGMT